jgi:hypothetical protein
VKVDSEEMRETQIQDKEIRNGMSLGARKKRSG